MGERTAHPPGTFSWVHLAAPDPEAAKAFYGGLFGWGMEDLPAGEAGTYTLCRLGGRAVAGISGRGAGDQGPPGWTSYITVRSADEAARRAAELGGTVAAEPADVMDAGRTARVADPTGASVALWEPRTHIGAERVNEPGCFSWNELATRDPEAAGRFYESLLGWRLETPDGLGGYQVIANDGRSNGGIRRIGDDEPAGWTVFFTVADIEAATAMARELGGSVPLGPLELPTGRFAMVQDPQGAAFALFAGEPDE